MTTAASSNPCFHCGVSVKPTVEGFCPSCTQTFRPAEPGQKTFGHRPASRRGPSPRDRFLVWVAIVLIVFPTLQWVISLFWGLLFTLPAIWITLSPSVTNTLQIVAQILGVVGSILICCKIWPSSD